MTSPDETVRGDRDPAESSRPSPLLSLPGAVAGTGPDAGVAWHYGDPVAEQRALERGHGVADQSNLGVVRVTGPDRLSWLHSITSQRLDDLAPFTSTETLVLSPQGHVEHAAGVVDDGEATWLVTETAAGLAAWLDSMRFMLRVEVADVTDHWAAIGESSSAEGEPGGPVVWRDPWPRVAAGGTRYGPPDEQHPGIERTWRLVLVPRTALADEIASRRSSGATVAGTWATEALRVAAWRQRAVREVDHRTIPHELDWLRTAVHLDKGCYRGQETVAKVHNLGHPPRRMVALHLDGSDDLLPARGDAVMIGGVAVGAVTSAARHYEEGPIALAIVKRSAPESGSAQVETSGGPVAATVQTVVPPEAGAAASVPRLTRLSRRR